MNEKEVYTCSAFGYGRYGQLGYNCVSFTRIPFIVTVPDPVFSISCGDAHSVILSETFKIYTF